MSFWTYSNGRITLSLCDLESRSPGQQEFRVCLPGVRHVHPTTSSLVVSAWDGTDFEKFVQLLNIPFILNALNHNNGQTT